MLVLGCNMISVIGQIRGEDYKRFVSFALSNSDAVMLIFQNYGRPFKKRIKEIRHALKPFRIASRNNHKNGEKEFKWPGTVTWTDDSLSLIHADVYRLAPEVEAYILSADDIFSWMYPERPEDISFFYKGKCWIDTTAHEEYCNIYDHEPEMARLLDSMGIEYESYSGDYGGYTEKYPFE